MSDQLQLRQDLQELTRAIQDLTIATRDLVERRTDRVEEAQRPQSLPASTPTFSSVAWELVVDGTAIPGAPVDFLKKPVVIEFEEGPPDIPDFCLDLARRHLSSAKASPEDRAKEAFRAGFWAREPFGLVIQSITALTSHWSLDQLSGCFAKELVLIWSELQHRQIVRSSS